MLKLWYKLDTCLSYLSGTCAVMKQTGSLDIWREKATLHYEEKIKNNAYEYNAYSCDNYLLVGLFAIV